MIRAALAFFALSGLLVVVPEARACRVHTTPENRIAHSYASYPDLQVAVVRITDARHLDTPIMRKMREITPESYAMSWRASASVTRLVRGDISPELLVFDRGSSCDDPIAVPSAGDAWVIYYIRDFRAPEVLMSYPLEMALRVDPKLRSAG